MNKEIKALKSKLDLENQRLLNKVEAYDREEKQLLLIQQNIQNIQNISEELLIEIEKIPLRKA